MAAPWGVPTRRRIAPDYMQIYCRGGRQGRDDLLFGLLLLVDLPVRERLRTELDVGDVGIDAVRAGPGGELPILHVAAACLFFLTPFVERFLAFALCCGGS